MIDIKSNISEKEWSRFLKENNLVSFYQTWATKECYEKMGKKVFNFAYYKNNRIKAVCLFIIEKAKRGNYLFCPHGPVINDWSDSVLFEEIISHIKKVAIKENVWFIKLLPYIISNDNNLKLLKKNGFLPSQLHSLVEESWCLDLDKTEDSLLLEMRKTNRNLIRRAIKEKVNIKMSSDIADVDVFYNLYKITAKRHTFFPYSRKFIIEQTKALLARKQAVILLGEYNNEIVASAIIYICNGEAIYYHGASSQKYPKIPVSYLIQWEAIKYAKEFGCKTYNFWGIYSGKNKKHPFAGITHFKKGFGGYQRNIIHCHDLPIKKFYWLTYFFEFIRKIKRGF